MHALDLNTFRVGDVFDFGETVLSEQEIIDFAKSFDPLEFHTDKEKAKQSFFKNLIASGPHVFNLVHRTKWIPLFGKTVICGLEINDWKFLKPVFADMPVHAQVKVLSIKPNAEKKHAAVKWRYKFTTDNGELVSALNSVVLHKIV
jgi:acyl dehydratase